MGKYLKIARMKLSKFAVAGIVAWELDQTIRECRVPAKTIKLTDNSNCRLSKSCSSKSENAVPFAS